MKNKLYVAIGLFCYASFATALVEEDSTPILSEQFDLSIPILHYKAKDETMSLWAEMKVHSVTKDGEILFKLSDYGVLDQPDTNKDTSTSTEPDEFAGIIKAHNVWRKKVGVSNLKWSSEAATIAQKWASSLKKNNDCQMEHNPKRGEFGENIYRSKGFNSTTTEVVDAWGEEIADYNYKTNTCKPDKKCGHYTQVVWNTTKTVGCGKVSCDGRVEVWVCNYAPPGNISGKKPY